MDFSSIELTNENWIAWNETYELEYCLDGLTTTYMHSGKGWTISSKPLVMYLYFPKPTKFNYIYMYYKTMSYLPSSFKVEISDDNSTYTQIAEYIDVEINSTDMYYYLDQFYSTNYIKFTISKVYGNGYLAMNILDFRLGPFNELTPEFPDYYGDVIVDNNNFALYGHSYTVSEGGKIKFTQSLKISYDNKETNLTIDEDTATDIEFSILESNSESRSVTVEVISGNFNVESIFYS